MKVLPISSAAPNCLPILKRARPAFQAKRGARGRLRLTAPIALATLRLAPEHASALLKDEKVVLGPDQLSGGHILRLTPRQIQKFEKAKAAGKGVTLGKGATIRELIEEGRE